MNRYKIVKGFSALDKKAKRYMKRTTPEGIITYHLFREKIYRRKTRYGPYNTIRQEAWSATFYDVGQVVAVTVLEEYEPEIDPNTIAIGFNF